MALDFGKLEFSVSFNPTSAFPLDARSYFKSIESAQAAASSATEVGKADSVYYYGQTLAVVENDIATLYIIQPNNTLQAVGKIDSDLFIYNEDGNLTLKGLDTAPQGSVPMKNSLGGFDWVIPVNAYSKSETDLKISEAIAAAPHLKRKVVGNVNDIDINAADADQYIYMVPTESLNGSNKYYEYIVMIIVDNDNIETRFLEQVGSWETNLDNYVTFDQLNLKVDKQEGYSLIPTDELAKLMNIAPNVESNVINSVSSDFIIDVVNNRQLKLQPVEATKIIGLEDLLGDKLVSQEDRNKLNALDFDNDDLVISGTVTADNVKNLNEWVTKWVEENSQYDKVVSGLSKHNLTDELYDKLREALHITKVNPTEFKIESATNELSILKVDPSKITGLEEALNEKASKTQVDTLSKKVISLEDRFTQYVTSYQDDLAKIWDVLTWKNINE